MDAILVGLWKRGYMEIGCGECSRSGSRTPRRLTGNASSRAIRFVSWLRCFMMSPRGMVSGSGLGQVLNCWQRGQMINDRPVSS